LSATTPFISSRKCSCRFTTPDDADVSSKALLMQSAMQKRCFVFGLCCVSRIFGQAASLSATLQSHNFDRAQCIEHVDRVFNEAKAMRNDAVSGFSSLFVEAQAAVTPFGCEIRAPRQCDRQLIGIHMEHRIRRHIIDCPHNALP
jgi:hypothetical protein